MDARGGPPAPTWDELSEMAVKLTGRPHTSGAITRLSFAFFWRTWLYPLRLDEGRHIHKHRPAARH